MIELGKEGKDKITGFAGIITARHQYITGCDQYTLTPQLKQGGGELGEQYSFDEGRIEIISNGVPWPSVQTVPPGGPQRAARSAK